jgi:hypothetical protein
MVQLPIAGLLGSFHKICAFSQLAATQVSARQGISLPIRDFAMFKDSCEVFRQSARETGLTVTAAVADELENDFSFAVTNGELVNFNEMTIRRLHNRFLSIIQCLHAESKSKVALVLPLENIPLFDQKAPPFGSEVHSKFPIASFDISEACKCLALGRHTASVFHLMRVMETALHAVHGCLGISNPIAGNDKTWGSILQKIRLEYRARPNFSEMALFQELHALLDAVKDAWRNGTMHVEDKKTEEEAKVIMITVKAFMQKLASRMDEQGLPLA